MSKPSHSEKRYMPGLDGLRTLAVFAVIIYHLNVKWAPGGLLGVSIFFVLSGYLITDLLTAEWSRKGTIDLKGFWVRRIRRLLPAMVVMMAAVVTWVTLFSPTFMPSLKGDAISSLLYINNWYLIFHQVSYFDKFGPSSPLGHLWSLAVEEQFYLLWPLLLIIGLRLAPRRGKMFIMILGAMTISALAMLLLYQPGSDPSRVYYGTDTRAFSLLMGAALSIVWPSRKLSNQVTRLSRNTLDGIGAFCLIIILIMIGTTGEYDSFLYPWGFLLLSLVTAAAIAVIAHPASLTGRILGYKPMKWLGARSYGIYLWHYPVIVLTSPLGGEDGSHVFRSIIQIAASLILASLSYKFIEEPIRSGLISRLWKKLRTGKISWSQLPLKGWVTTSSVLILVIISCASITRPPVNASTSIDKQVWVQKPDSKANQEPAKNSETKPEVEPQNKPVTSPDNKSETHQDHESGKKPDSQSTSKSGSTAVKSPIPVTAIGDSVLLDAEPYLKQFVPNIVVDARIGRQMLEAPEVVAQLRSEGKLGDIVVIELGTNGSFNSKQLMKVLDTLQDAKKVVIVNTRVPRNWEGVVNSTLQKAADAYPNTILLDWHSASSGKSIFSPDGVHLKSDGAKMLASLIAGSVGYKNLSSIIK